MKEKAKSLRLGSLERKHEAFICISPEVNADALKLSVEEAKAMTKENLPYYESMLKQKGFESYHKGKGGWLDKTGDEPSVKMESSYIVSSMKRDGVSYPEEFKALGKLLMRAGSQACFTYAEKQDGGVYAGLLVVIDGTEESLGTLSRISDVEDENLEGWTRLAVKVFIFRKALAAHAAQHKDGGFMFGMRG